MGCAASTHTGAPTSSSSGSDIRGSKQSGGAIQFTDAVEDEPSERSVRAEVDMTAIEEQSHINGEQSLLALAMNAPPRADNTCSTSSPLKAPADRALQRRQQPRSTEIDAPLAVASALDSGGTNTTNATIAVPTGTHAATSLNAVTSPMKIRIRESHSVIVTTEEHEHTKLLPDLTYSMRSSAGASSQFAANDTSQFSRSSALPVATGTGAAGMPHTQPLGAARRLQPIASMSGDGIEQQQQQQQSSVTATAPSLQHHQILSPAAVSNTADRLIPTLHATAGRSRGREGLSLEFVPQRALNGAVRGLVNPVSPLHRSGSPVGPRAPGSSPMSAGRGQNVVAPPSARSLPRPLLPVPGQSSGVQSVPIALRPAADAANRPQHLIAPSSLQSPTSRTLQESRVVGSNGAIDSDDDDDLLDDDDEVGDWDLDDNEKDGGDKLSHAVGEPSGLVAAASQASQIKQPPSPHAVAVNGASARTNLPTSFVHPQPQLPSFVHSPLKMPAQHLLRVSTAAPVPSPPPRALKFRPAFENLDDINMLAHGATHVESNSDDDDSDDNDNNEDVEDWFEADIVVTGAARSPLVTPAPAAATAAATAPSIGTTAGTGLFVHTHASATTPTFRPPPSVDVALTKLSLSPHPPMQRLPSRQTIASGRLSPTKQHVVNSSVGSPLAGSSPLKQVIVSSVGSPLKQVVPASLAGSSSPLKQQVSYRSNIVGVTQPALLPMALAASGTASGASIAATSKDAIVTNAPIRDTIVVKKKRAELPKRNLPHPTPKFGDWLNSRTMINNYIILEPLGSGSFAEVKLCKEKVSGSLFAMKFINRDIVKRDKLGKQSKLDDIKREIAIMKKLSHPNVLRLYEVMDDPSMNKLFLVLEYMKHGDLLSHQKKKNVGNSGATAAVATPTPTSLHDRDLHAVFVQVVLGLAYLHDQKIVHGDIKPQNILVGDKDAVKIADFGISQSLYGSKQKLSDTAGTPAFMSPEMCSGDAYSGQLADVWAVGATIYMLKFGHPPFVATSALVMFDKIQNAPLVFPSPLDPLLQDLLVRMMLKDPTQRIALDDVLTHPWITRVNESLLSYPLAIAPRSRMHGESPRIIVTRDEMDHAVGTSDSFAVIVNIRIQMRKHLQRARNAIAARHRRLLVQAEGSESADDDSRRQVGREDATISSTNDAMRSHDINNSSRNIEDDLHLKTAKLKTPKHKQNRVHVVANDRASSPVTDALCETKSSSLKYVVSHDELSSAEIRYRAQMFSRRKTGSTSIAPSSTTTTASNKSREYSRDDGANGNAHDAVNVIASNTSPRIYSDGDSSSSDNDAQSTDSDDDEAAVAQSPQLLDELLLTTLSMPPLTKHKSTSDERLGDAANSSCCSSTGCVSTITSSSTQGTSGHESHSPRMSTVLSSGRSGNTNETFYGASTTLPLRFGVASLQGRRSTQEDRWVALPHLGNDAGALPSTSQYASSAFVGLYDGHGGEECASILHEQLHAWLFRDLHNNGSHLTPAELATHFEDLDTYVCDYLQQKGDLSGSTATCVILQPSDSSSSSSTTTASATIRCTVAHVGDCRLVLGLRDSTGVCVVTQDHRLTLHAERERILARGGRVVNNRVNGVMAITRAFGDLEFKGLLSRGNSASTATLALLTTTLKNDAATGVRLNPFERDDDEKIPALLTARPDVDTIELDPQTHEFLLLACDGLWDVLSSDEAAAILRERLHLHADVQLAAKELAQEAIRRYSNDNITVIAIELMR